MFDKETKDLIVAGKKTQTRRLRKNDNRPAIPNSIHKLKTDRSPKTWGYIKIISCEKATFKDIKKWDVLKEGFHSLEEYMEYFMTKNGRINKNTPIWIINFRLIKRCD